MFVVVDVLALALALAYSYSSSILIALALDTFAFARTRKSTCKKDHSVKDLEKINDENPDPDLLHVDARLYCFCLERK